MTRNGGTQHRHPDAVDCLEGLTEGEAAVHPPVVREHEDGFTRYWLEGGEVRSRDVRRDELPLAGAGSPGAALAEFGPLLPRLAADPGSGVPDLDGVERALRDASPGGGAAAQRFEREEETEGVRGRQADGTSRTREAKLAVACTAEGRDPGTGAAARTGAANPSPA